MRRLRRPAQIGVGLALALAWALVGAAGDSHAADDPMLGKTAIGALDSWISADYKLATKFSLAAPGSISRISVYLYGSGTSGAQALRAIVYSDVGGAPDKLLSTSKEVTVAAKAAPAWVDFQLSAPLDLAAGDYWLGLHGGTITGDALTYFAYDEQAKVQALKWDAYADGASDPFGPAEERSREMSIYAPVAPAPPLRPPAPPLNVAPPTLSGTAREGETLQATAGSWDGAQPIAYAYQWQRCTADAKECVTIDSATADTYALSRADVGGRLRVEVLASNVAGSTTAVSALSDVVAAAPARQEGTSPVNTAADGSAAETATAPLFVSTPWSTYLGYRSRTKGCRVVLALPDRRCTPGAAFSTATRDDVCSLYLASLVPAVPWSVARLAYRSYGIRRGQRTRFPLDHLVPLELGGSNSIANVWPQPNRSRPGRAAKNQLERLLHERVCAGSLTLRVAQRLIARDWVTAYRHLQP